MGSVSRKKRALAVSELVSSLKEFTVFLLEADTETNIKKGSN